MHEADMGYLRWMGDNIWTYVPAQAYIAKFLATIPEYPFQPGSSLNAAGINYQFAQGHGSLETDGNVLAAGQTSLCRRTGGLPQGEAPRLFDRPLHGWQPAAFYPGFTTRRPAASAVQRSLGVPDRCR